MRRKNYEGLVIGKTTIGSCVEIEGKRKWNATCECGKKWLINVSKISRIKGAGCLDCSHKKQKHGMSRSKIYRMWFGMKQRCSNKNQKSYIHYGGRGISICKEWMSIELFYEWAINNGYKEGLSIDRIDVNGNYEPNNCRWATDMEQGQNQRKTVKYELNGITKCRTEWCREYQISVPGLEKRLRAGMTLLDALQTTTERKGQKSRIKAYISNKQSQNAY